MLFVEVEDAARSDEVLPREEGDGGPLFYFEVLPDGPERPPPLVLPVYQQPALVDLFLARLVVLPDHYGAQDAPRTLEELVEVEEFLLGFLAYVPGVPRLLEDPDQLLLLGPGREKVEDHQRGGQHQLYRYAQHVADPLAQSYLLFAVFVHYSDQLNLYIPVKNKRRTCHPLSQSILFPCLLGPACFFQSLHRGLR